MSEALIELSNALAAATARAAAYTVAVHASPRGSSSASSGARELSSQRTRLAKRRRDLRYPSDQRLEHRVVSATLVGRDPTTDLAVLKCRGGCAGVCFWRPTALAVGHLALVVGRTRASGPVAALGAVSLAVAERSTGEEPLCRRICGSTLDCSQLRSAEPSWTPVAASLALPHPSLPVSAPSRFPPPR